MPRLVLDEPIKKPRLVLDEPPEKPPSLDRYAVAGMGGFSPHITRETAPATDVLTKFGRGVKQDPLSKLGPIGVAGRAVEDQRVVLAKKLLADPNTDWESVAEQQRKALDWQQNKPQLVPPMSQPDYKTKRQGITSETAKQQLQGIVQGFEKYSQKQRAAREEGGMAYKVGQITSQMPSWMLDFYITGGPARAASVPAKRALRSLVGKGLLARVGSWGVGAATRATVSPHRLFATTLERELQRDEEPLTALSKAWLSTAIEYGSEVLGGTLLRGGLSKAGARKIGRQLRTGPLTKRFINAIEDAWKAIKPKNTSAAFADRMLTKGGFNGVIGELGEERIATILHGIVGTEDFGLGPDAGPFDRMLAGIKQDFDPENIGAEAVSFGLVGAGQIGIAQLGGPRLVPDEPTFAPRQPRIPEGAPPTAEYQPELGREAFERLIRPKIAAKPHLVPDEATPPPVEIIAPEPTEAAPEVSERAVAKRYYTSVPDEWRSQATLTSWGQKGLRSKGNVQIAGRKSFIWSNEFEQVPTRMPQVIKAARAKTDEIFKVSDRRGEDYWLVPKKAMEELRSELPEEAFVRQPLSERTPNQKVNDSINSMKRHELEDAEVGAFIEKYIAELGLTKDDLTANMKKYLEALRNDPEIEKLRQSVREGMEEAVQPVGEEIEERAAIQQETELTAEIGDFLEGLIEEPQRRPGVEQGVFGQEVITPISGKQQEFLEKEDFRLREPDIEGQQILPEPGGGVAWQHAISNVLKLAEKDRPKIVRQQKKSRSERFGAMAGTREWLLGKGLPGREAVTRATGQLAGQQANYEGRYIPLQDILEEWTIKAAEEDIARNPALTEWDRANMMKPDGTGAWDKMLRGAAMAPWEVRLIRKWHPDLGKEAAKRIPFMVKFFGQIEQIMGIWKFGAAFDVQMRRQARWIRANHPVLFGKTVGKNLMAYVSQKQADKMAQETEDDPNYKDAKKHGVRFLERHVRKGKGARTEQYISALPEYIPGIGKIYSASIRGFVDSFNWLQMQLWNNKIDQWIQQSTDITAEMKYQLADTNNTLLGMVKPKSTFGRAMRRVLSPVMWSPTLTWSRIRTPSMILTNPKVAGETALTLGSYFGSGMLALLVASMIARALKKKGPVEWDPRSPDFGKIRIGDTRIDVFGDGGPYMRALAQLLFQEKKNQAGRLRKRPRMSVIKQFIRNKRAPIFDLLGKIWTGRTYYGGAAWELPDWEEYKKEGGKKAWIAEQAQKATETARGEKAFLATREVVDTFLPFFIESSLQALWHDGWQMALVAGTDEFFSGQALSYEPSNYGKLQILQDTAGVAKFDKVWDDLNPVQQKVIILSVPEIREFENKIDAERMPPEEISLKEQNQAADRIRRALPRDMQKQLRSAGVRIKGVPRRVGSYWLNDERYEELQDRIAKNTEIFISNLPNIEKLPPRQKQAALQLVTDKAREFARKQVIIGTYK